MALEWEEARHVWHSLRDHLAFFVTIAFEERERARLAIQQPLMLDWASLSDGERFALANNWSWPLRRVVPVLQNASAKQAGPLDDLKSRLERLQHSITFWDSASTAELYAEVRLLCERLLIPVNESRWLAIEDDLQFLAYYEEAVERSWANYKGAVLFEAERSQVLVPQLIVPAHDYLLDLIRRDPQGLFGLTGRQFEELISEIFARRGFAVELTQATRDGGRDIIAIRQELDIPVKLIIECKRYAPERKVSLGVVQRLYGVKTAESANKAILATTSAFTSPAMQFAETHIWDLDLKGYDAIVKWIRETGAA